MGHVDSPKLHLVTILSKLAGPVLIGLIHRNHYASGNLLICVLTSDFHPQFMLQLHPQPPLFDLLSALMPNYHIRDGWIFGKVFNIQLSVSVKGRHGLPRTRIHFFPSFRQFGSSELRI